MNSKSIRTPDWPGHSPAQDPIKQLFDRVFEGGLFQNASSDDSSVVTSQWVPRVDIKEEAHRFVLYADIPGVEPGAIGVQMDKGMLTIKGERKAPQAVNPTWIRQECPYGKFSRTVSLPWEIDAESVEAGLHEGVLTVTLSRSEKCRTRKVNVQTT